MEWAVGLGGVLWLSSQKILLRGQPDGNGIPLKRVNSKEDFIRGTPVICPKCGEDNADNFRFCGMCGTELSGPRLPKAATAGKVPQNEIPVALKIPANPPRAGVTTPRAGAPRPVEPISGPSLLGLDQSNVDSSREEIFSGRAPRFEIEERPTGGRRVLTLLLLLALGGAGWWIHKNYARVAGSLESLKPRAGMADRGAAASPQEKAAANQAAPETTATKSSDAGQAAAPAPAAATGEAASENRAPEKPTEKADSKPAETAAATAEAKPGRPQKTVETAKVAKADRIAAMRHRSVKAALPKAPASTADDSGDAFFRKGEAYLYGRGVRQNCDQAIKYLKQASAQSHAKARSTMGTMYATGHCVPRDLPSSYGWFAKALQADPNNRILEKDLSAIWNQMTPPERQMATKMKQ